MECTVSQLQDSLKQPFPSLVDLNSIYDTGSIRPRTSLMYRNVWHLYKSLVLSNIREKIFGEFWVTLVIKFQVHLITFRMFLLLSKII